MKLGIYSGSFNPVTLGHVDIIKRASLLFDELYVVIAQNPEKQATNNNLKRQLNIVAFKENIFNIKIRNLEDFGEFQTIAKLVEYLNAVSVRGIRDSNDLNYEFNLETINLRLNPDLKTIYLKACPEYIHVSSSVVRNVVKYGGNIKGLVPEYLEEEILEMYKEK